MAETSESSGEAFQAATMLGKKGPAEAGGTTLTAAQEALVRDNIGLVGVHLRRRVPIPRQPMRQREYDDLFQVGSLALVKAAMSYVPERHGEFGAYALPRIRRAIHKALYELFATIRVPVRALKQSKARSPNHRPPHERMMKPAGELLALSSTTPFTSGDQDERIRHAIRRRLERLVRIALEEAGHFAWRQRDPVPILTRIAQERFLIPREEDRTPLRAIARAFGISSGRASAYEQRLLGLVCELARRDPRLPILLQFAWDDPAGLDGVLDAERRRQLSRAEADAFAVAFERMGRQEQAETLYRLVERSTPAIAEVAANLFRLV